MTKGVALKASNLLSEISDMKLALEEIQSTFAKCEASGIFVSREIRAEVERIFKDGIAKKEKELEAL